MTKNVYISGRLRFDFVVYYVSRWHHMKCTSHRKRIWYKSASRRTFVSTLAHISNMGYSAHTVTIISHRRAPFQGIDNCTISQSIWERQIWKWCSLPAYTLEYSRFYKRHTKNGCPYVISMSVGQSKDDNCIYDLRKKVYWRHTAT